MIEAIIAVLGFAATDASADCFYSRGASSPRRGGAAAASEPAPLQIHDPHRHGSAWVERQILKAEGAVDIAHAINDRMGEDAEAAELLRHPQACGQGEQHQRSADPPPP